MSRLQIEAEIAARLREQLADLVDDDDQLWSDTVAGETELEELIAATLSEADEAEAAADRLKQRREQMAAREHRFRARSKAAKRAVVEAMLRAGLQKIVRDEVTISTARGRQRLELDEAELSKAERERFWHCSWSPDRVAIFQALKAGEDVPGAELRDGDLSLRVKRT